MTRSRKVVGCCGIKAEEGAGRGTAVLIYRSRVMWPGYVTVRQPGWTEYNTLMEDHPHSHCVLSDLHALTCSQALMQQIPFF